MKLSKRFGIDLTLLVALLVILLMRPYFFWMSPDIIMILGAIAITFIAILQTKIKGNKNIDLLFLLVFAYLFLSFVRGARVGGTLINLSFAFLPFMKMDFLLKVYEKFRFIIIGLFTLSMVSYITVLFGLQTSSELIEPLNDLKQLQYAKFFFLVLPSTLDGFARYCSVFDEPGVVGTLAGLMMCVEGFNFKKKGNIVIFLNGLLSLSLFFYLISAIFLLYRLPGKYKILFVAGVIALYVFTIDNEILKIAIWDRLSFNEEGSLSGDNRNSEELLAVWDRAKFNVQILFGYGEKFVRDYTGSASIQLFILRDGLLFVLMYFAVYLLYAKRIMKSNRDFVLFGLILFLTLYQRPGFCGIDFTLLFSTYILSKSKSNVSINSSRNLQLCRISR